MIMSLGGAFDKKSDVFELGQLVMTAGIAKMMDLNYEFAIEVFKSYTKYINADWGDTCANDCELNAEALKTGERILAKYITSKGDVFIITEWDRSVTTILFANEY